MNEPRRDSSKASAARGRLTAARRRELFGVAYACACLHECVSACVHAFERRRSAGAGAPAGQQPVLSIVGVFHFTPRDEYSCTIPP